MAIIFPTETLDILDVIATDRLLIADSQDSENLKDISLIEFAQYVAEELRASNDIPPKPTEEQQSIVTDANLIWQISKIFDLGNEYDDPQGLRLQFRRREPNMGGSGPPVEHGLIGEIAINFDVGVGNMPEMWCYNGTFWRLINIKDALLTETIVLVGGTPGTPVGIGQAWFNYEPKPTTDFVIAEYGLTPYLKNGPGVIDSDWVPLVPNDILAPAVNAAAAAAVQAGDYASDSATAALDAEMASDAATEAANRADTYASGAEDSANNSAVKATESRNWATYPVDNPVPEGSGSEYSALHWYTKTIEDTNDCVIGISGNEVISIDETDPRRPIVNYVERVVDLHPSTDTLEIDASSAEIFNITVDANLTINFTNWGNKSRSFQVYFTTTVDALTITWTDVRWIGGAPPTYTIAMLVLHDFYSFDDGFTIIGKNHGEI